MFNQRAAHLRTAFLSAVAALLLLTTAGQSAALTNASVTAQPNTTVDAGGPVVLALHKPCRSEHENYCGNGGECMYPQDSDKPFCICTPKFDGPRCLLFSDQARSQPELEKLIGISFAVVMLIIALAVIACCFAQKRCMKSAPLIKSALSETLV